jgi:hypothetical protein
MGAVIFFSAILFFLAVSMVGCVLGDRYEKFYQGISTGYRIVEDRIDRLKFVPEFRDAKGSWHPFDFQCDCLHGDMVKLTPVRDMDVKFYRKDFDSYEDAEKFLKDVKDKFGIFPTIWQDLLHRPLFAFGLDGSNPNTAQPGQTVRIQMTSDE